MEEQGEDPAQLTYAQLMQRSAEGGNWQRALELFDGGRQGGGATEAWRVGKKGLGRADTCPRSIEVAACMPMHWRPGSLACHPPCPPGAAPLTRPAPGAAPAGMESSLALAGSQPNGLTYSAAIIACARLADWQRALELKDQMLARWESGCCGLRSARSSKAAALLMLHVRLGNDRGICGGMRALCELMQRVTPVWPKPPCPNVCIPCALRPAPASCVQGPAGAAHCVQLRAGRLRGGAAAGGGAGPAG